MLLFLSHATKPCPWLVAVVCGLQEVEVLSVSPQPPPFRASHVNAVFSHPRRPTMRVAEEA